METDLDSDPNRWPMALSSDFDWGFVAEPGANLNDRAIPYSMGKGFCSGCSINVSTWSAWTPGRLGLLCVGVARSSGELRSGSRDVTGAASKLTPETPIRVIAAPTERYTYSPHRTLIYSLLPCSKALNRGVATLSEPERPNDGKRRWMRYWSMKPFAMADGRLIGPMCTLCWRRRA